MPQQQVLGAVDTTWAGPYRLISRLRGGGGRAAYLAWTPSGEKVTVVLHAGVRDAHTRDRVARQVRAARAVADPGVARVLDADLLAAIPYVVGEYVAGPTLAEAVAAAGPLTGAALDRLALATAGGLAAIHRAGIGHGDVGPDNVVLAADGARIVNLVTVPEQVAAVSPAADMFAWASTIVVAATGRDPVTAGTSSARARPVVRLPPGVPGPLGAVVRDCLAEDQARRPAADDVVARLRAAGAGDGPFDDGPFDDGPFDDDVDGPVPLARRRGLTATGLVLVGLLSCGVLAGAGWWINTSRGPDPSDAVAAGAQRPADAPAARPSAPAAPVVPVATPSGAPAATTAPAPAPSEAPQTPAPSVTPPPSVTRAPARSPVPPSRPVPSRRPATSSSPAAPGGPAGSRGLAIPAAFAGTWQGQVLQPRLAARTFPLVLSLARGATAGTMVLPSAGCAAQVLVIGVDSDGTRISLLQRTTSDPGRRCAPTALIELTAARGGALVLGWQDAADPRNTASGTLTRTTAAR